MVPIYGSKNFLKKDGFHSTASICVNIFTKYYEIAVSDCNRSITLYNNIQKKVDYDNAVFKIEQLVSELSGALDFLKSNPPKTRQRINKS